MLAPARVVTIQATATVRVTVPVPVIVTRHVVIVTVPPEPA